MKQKNLKFILTTLFMIVGANVFSAISDPIIIEYNILFDDPIVKSLCVTNWDTDGDGELSTIEAAAVTDISQTFQNSDITSFDELGYFLGLTNIDSWAFAGCYGLKSIVIPYNISAIGDWAFSNCSSLASVIFSFKISSIDSKVTSIGEGAFYGCSGLTYLSIPDRITTIGRSAFYGCSGLTKITIPNSVTSLGDYAFAECSGLTSITIPENVKSIGEGTFSWCSSLTSATISNRVTGIGNQAFLFCTCLTSVTIPNSVTDIGYGAFQNCSSLTSVTIPNGVRSIGSNAFHGCSSLSSITIPSSVKSIPTNANAFSNCSSLGSIVVEEGNTVYDSRENCNAIIEKATNTLISGCMNSFIPNSVTSIGDEAFYGCSGLTSITIPKSVTCIGTSTIRDSYTYLTYNPFVGCDNLESIIVEEGNARYDTRNGCNAIIETKYKSLIAGCKNTIIPEGITWISRGAFSGCSGLTSITIPSSVEYIDGNPFSGCDGLESIVVAKGNTSYYSINGCNAIFKNGVGDSEDRFLVLGCKNTIIPKNTVGIQPSAFSDLSSLTSITIPNSVRYIGREAFWRCDGLSSITIPDGVSYIYEYTFYECSGLSSITIPSSMKTIESWNFYGSTNLVDVYCFAKDVPEAEGGVFANCNNESVTLHVPASAIDDYKSKDPWNTFNKIVALTDEELTAIKNIENEQEIISNEATEIYDLQGHRLSQPQRGVNIIRTADGKTRKVLVK